jgi:hypothetical protein
MGVLDLGRLTLVAMQGFKNFARRTMESTPYVAPGVVLTVLIYKVRRGNQQGV